MAAVRTAAWKNYWPEGNRVPGSSSLVKFHRIAAAVPMTVFLSSTNHLSILETPLSHETTSRIPEADPARRERRGGEGPAPLLSRVIQGSFAPLRRPGAMQCRFGEATGAIVFS